VIHYRLHPRLLHSLSIRHLLTRLRQVLVTPTVRVWIERECDERVDGLREDFQRKCVVACLFKYERLRSGLDYLGARHLCGIEGDRDT
jgi:hypothetical protein